MRVYQCHSTVVSVLVLPVLVLSVLVLSVLVVVLCVVRSRERENVLWEEYIALLSAM